VPDDFLRSIGSLADSLGSSLRPMGHETLLRSIAEVARAMFGAAACSIALLDETGEYLEYTFATGIGADRTERLRIPSSQGIAGWAVSTGQPIEVGDVSKDPRFARGAAEATGYVPQSVLAMPLEGARGTIGVLSVLTGPGWTRDRT
jgi:signal transduction protein with GAF and PtsI domain